MIKDDLVPPAGVGAKARVHGTLVTPVNLGPKTPTWSWRATFVKDGAVIMPAKIGDDPSQVQFEVPRDGLYDVYATVTNTGVPCAQGFLRIKVEPPCSACVRFRINPPAADGVVVPVQEVPSFDVASRSILDLEPGLPVTVEVQDDQGNFLPSYVRLGGVGSLVVEGNTARGPLNTFWLTNRPYELLVIPAPGRAIAPQVFTRQDQGGVFALDLGTFVTGNAVDGDGKGLLGTKVLLRAGNRPSSIGTADSKGDFNLTARPGVLSAVIVPPVASGLPQANLGANAGIILDTNQRHLSIEWARVSRSALSLTVSSTTGVPVEGARVRVESADEIQGVAKVNVYLGDAPQQELTASGSVRLDAVTNAVGVAAFPAVPTGTYRVIAAPPTGSTAGVLTTTTLTKTAAAQSVPISFVAAVTLTGTLAPATPATVVAGARVYARDTGTGLVADDSVATTDGTGKFSLRVAPFRTYSVVAEQVRGAFARTVLGPPVPVGGDAVQTLATTRIRPAKPYALQVAGAGTLAGIVVQAFCVASSTSCLDPDLPLAETLTAPDGSFTLLLPDPAL